MVCDVAVDEIRDNGSVPKLSVASVHTVMPPVVQLCTADKPHGIASFSEQRAADEAPSMDTVPEFGALDSPVKELVSKDTNCDNLELNTSSQHNDSEYDSKNEQQEKPSQGICSQSIIDLTETDASDSMLLDGLRTMLQKRQDMRQERSVLKEQRNKRSRADGAKANGHMNKERATAYTKFSIGYFVKIVDIVCKSKHRMELVRNNGFGYLLELDDCLVPRPFVQWVADNISTKDEAIVLRRKQIPLNVKAVSLVLSIPAGSTQIRTMDEETGKAEFLSLFGLTDLPSISYFRNKLKNEDLPDDDYLRCFLTMALATFLCLTSNTKLSTKYLGVLVDISKLKDLDWCSFVHSWSMCYVNKYQTDKQKEKRITTTFGGCIYQLAVRCLDFNNFGSISIPSAVPRICFWKGKTIKHFSDMLIAKKGLYAPLQIKDEAETCYAEKDGGWASTAKNTNIRRAIERVVDNSFSDKVKEDIFIKFQDRMKDENLKTCMIAKQMLLDTLHIVSSSFGESQGTVKAESSGHMYMPTNEENASGSTVRVDSNGIEINSDRSVRKKRRKTSTQQSAGSTTGNAVSQNEIKGTTTQVAGTTVHEAATETREPQLLKEQEQQAKIEQMKDIAVSCGSNPEVKMVDVDKKAPESNGKFCNTGKAVPELSSSLNYMLLVAKLASEIDGSEPDINSKDERPKDDGPSFSGFLDNVVARETFLQSKLEDQPNEKQKSFVLSQVNKHKDHKKHVEMDIDINMPLSENKDKQTNGKGIQDSLHPLDIAREKYFFVDDSTPSCRILEEFDDCGNEILEPELWPPLWMDTKTYNAKIEVLRKGILFFPGGQEK